MASRFVQQAEIGAADDDDDDDGHPIMGEAQSTAEWARGMEEEKKKANLRRPSSEWPNWEQSMFPSLLRRQRQIAAIHLAGQSGSDEIMVRWAERGQFSRNGEREGDVGNSISYKNATLV